MLAFESTIEHRRRTSASGAKRVSQKLSSVGISIAVDAHRAPAVEVGFLLDASDHGLTALSILRSVARSSTRLEHGLEFAIRPVPSGIEGDAASDRAIVEVLRSVQRWRSGRTPSTSAMKNSASIVAINVSRHPRHCDSWRDVGHLRASAETVRGSIERPSSDRVVEVLRTPPAILHDECSSGASRSPPLFNVLHGWTCDVRTF